LVTEQRTLSLTAFLAEPGVHTGLQVYASASVADAVAQRLGKPVLRDLAQTDPKGTWLLVVGGGAAIDRAKLWRRDTNSSLRLAAAASLWGSGAEASPIAVGPGLPKRIALGSDLRPDIRVQWPELADSLSESQVRWACGDVWSHALEGLLSPLARGEVEAGLADTVKALLNQPIGRAPVWFELGARACALQAQASVGLVHGIAHVLEPRLAAAGHPEMAAHARLCATLLWPVFRFNQGQSAKAADKLTRHGIDPGLVEQRLLALFDPTDFAMLQPLLRQHWNHVLRDACTRTNVALVRNDALEALLRGAT
jgi:alcohol dehydrogenase class IV